MAEGTGNHIDLGSGVFGVVEALQALLDELDPDVDPAGGSAEPEDPTALLSTGRVYLDRLLGGGLRRGCVTLVEADTSARARPLLLDICLHAPHVVLVAGRHLLEGTAALLGAAARVPRLELTRARVSEASWKRITSEIGALAQRDIWLTQRSVPASLRADVHACRAEVLVIDDLGRMGEAPGALRALRELALGTGVAVVAGSGAMGELGLQRHPRVVRVGLHPSDIPGRTVLVRADELDMVRVEDVIVDPATEALN